MANVSVYNIEGKEVGTIDLNDAVFGVEVREHRKRKLVLKFPEVEENHGDRKEQVMQDRVLQDLHSGQAVELYSLQHQEITP